MVVTEAQLTHIQVIYFTVGPCLAPSAIRDTFLWLCWHSTAAFQQQHCFDVDFVGFSKALPNLCKLTRCLADYKLCSCVRFCTWCAQDVLFEVLRQLQVHSQLNNFACFEVWLLLELLSICPNRLCKSVWWMWF